MQIELIGCTGAGKSTLAHAVVHDCRKQGLDIMLGEEFVLEQCHANWVRQRPVRKLLVNLAGVFASLLTWRNNRQFYFFATKILIQLPGPWLERLNLLRNVLKRTGVAEIIRFRGTGQQVVLVDEGALQTAHNLFVHLAVEREPGQLAAFAGLVPLPDAVIYLKQPEEVLVARTLARGHRRIPDLSEARVGHFVKQAVAMFDELVAYPAVKDRTMVLDGSPEAARHAERQDSQGTDLVLRVIQSHFMANTNYQPPEVIDVEQSIQALE